MPPSGAATRANPAKAGDAKLRGYRAPFRDATPVGPPNGSFCLRRFGMRPHPWVTAVAVLATALGVAACLDTAAPTLDGPHTVATVAIDPPQASTNVGKHVSFTATVLDSDGKPVSGHTVTWTSQDTLIAAVSPEGEVTAKQVGSTTITASTDDKSGTATLTVLPPVVAAVEVAPPNITMVVGDSTRLTATVHDDIGQVITGRTISWSSASTGVARVSTAGVVTAVAQGTTTITATVEGQT